MKITRILPVVPETLENGTIIYWNRIFRKPPRNHRYIPVMCGMCKEERSIEPSKIKINGKFTGLCNQCRLRSLNIFMGKNVDHPSWKGGRFKLQGYWFSKCSILSEEEQKMAEKMQKKYADGNFIVAEHRLVVAVSLGRPLISSEHVHHKNGIKTDNRIENLELVTSSEHMKLSVKYYELWQEALAYISELKSELEKFKGEGVHPPSPD